MIAPSFAFNLFHPMDIADLIRDRQIRVKIDTALLWVLSLAAANLMPIGR